MNKSEIKEWEKYLIGVCVDGIWFKRDVLEQFIDQYNCTSYDESKSDTHLDLYTIEHFWTSQTLTDLLKVYGFKDFYINI